MNRKVFCREAEVDRMSEREQGSESVSVRVI